ncbi:hypothetical protein E3G68_005106 [Mycobacteroides abscessus]|nr:hypothetical protein [Mycobacteroides abscessus]
MGWAIGFDSRWQRDVGYGVPAWCDHPNCHTMIDRGLSNVCGGQPYGGDNGCGLYFCDVHQHAVWDEEGDDVLTANGEPLIQLCERCVSRHEGSDTTPFDPKPDHPEWASWKLTHDSWAQWRSENPDAAERLRALASA